MSQEIDMTMGTVEASPETQKMLSVEKVNEIVKREKAAALEKGRREAAEQYQSMAGNAAQPSQGAQPNLNVDEIYNQIRQKFMEDAQREQEEKQQAAYQEEVKNVASSYYSKMNMGKSLYEDFEAVTSDFDPAAFPQLTFLIAGMENTPDIVYELAKNPQKLATIDLLANRDPKVAKKQLQKLAESINANKEALAKNPEISAPLSQLRPSPTAGVDSGKMGIRDYKKLPFLRG